MLDADGKPIWASGRSNDVGVLLNGTSDNETLKTDFLEPGGLPGCTQNYQPHYQTITEPCQVQIYEELSQDSDGVFTTSFVHRVKEIKDNRLLPRGFDKTTADEEVAVQGSALGDANFTGGGDTIHYSIATGGGQGPWQVEAELWFQPVSYRWAQNLKAYDAFEPQRFVGYYETMAPGSGVMLAHAAASR